MILISDACVLIDIVEGQLTKAMFSLPYKFAVPDILFVEELSVRHKNLLGFGLIVKAIRSELIAKAYYLQQEYTKPSINDLLALMLAQDEKSLLLTSDKVLRKLAEKFNVEVHGTIWLVKQMLEEEIISDETASAAFQRMKRAGSHLPWAEVEKLFVPIF